MNAIINEIFNGQSISHKESQVISSSLKKIKLKKGAFLLRAGDEVENLYYTHTGCLRNFIIDTEGRENTLQFAIKGWWISDYISLYGNQKQSAVSFIECLKESEVYSISKSTFEQICHDYPHIALFHIGKMELAFASFQNRILENLTLTAKQRYINFLNSYPSITNDVKNYHIASYLGITNESLSRIRKEMATS